MRTHTESGSLRGLKTRGQNSKHWTGYQEISGSYWNNIQKSAKERGIEFNVSIEYIWDAFIKQNRKCFFSNVELSFGSHNKDKSHRTASLDRIDSFKGYVEGNLQWVHKSINHMKMQLSNDEFISFCNLVHNTHSKD